MRLKLYHHFEIFIIITFPYFIVSYEYFKYNDEKEKCDNNVTKFLLENCTMNFTSPDDKIIQFNLI